MVNRTVYNYLRKNYGRLSSEDLKREILAKGYSDIEYGEALSIIRSEKDGIKAGKRLPFAKIERKRGFSWLLIGLVSTSILFFYSLFCFFMFYFDMAFFVMNKGVFVIFLAGLFLFCFFFYIFSFYYVGKLFKSKFLRSSCFFLIIFYLLFIISTGCFGAYLYSYFSGLSENVMSIPYLTGNAIITDFNSVGSPFYSEISDVGSYSSLFASFFTDFISSLPFALKFFFVLSGVFFFGFLFSYLLFSVGLFKMRKDIPFSGFAGIFRFVFVFLFLIFCFYILVLLLKGISDPSYLAFLITDFSSYSFFLRIMLKILCFLNVLCFVFEMVVLSKCYKKGFE